MNLFSDDELFSSGPLQKLIFDLPEADLVLYEHLFEKGDADRLYHFLLQQIPWQEFDWTVYGKTHRAPRMTCWFEDADNYGADRSNTTWPDELLEIRNRVEEASRIKFNSVLLNLYRNGEDCVGWHSDRAKNFGKDQIIGSVSFGETRPFRLRHKFRKNLKTEIPLRHGSFLLMAGTTQSYWEHQIPRTAKDILPRINLTFRQIDRQRYQNG